LAEEYSESLTVFDLLPAATTASHAREVLAQRAALPDQFRAFLEQSVSPTIQEALFAACCVRPRQPLLFISEFLFKGATGRARWAELKAEARAARAVNERLRMQLAAAGVGVDGALPSDNPTPAGAAAPEPPRASAAPPDSAATGAAAASLQPHALQLVQQPQPPPPSASIAYEVFLNESAGLLICLCRLLPGCTLEPIVTSDPVSATRTVCPCLTDVVSLYARAHARAARA
jgi:hypothetical protein